jgi:hypothetical protein
MSPDIAPYFYIYATIFRLAIIAAGVVSIVLGYRLFCKDNWADTPMKGTDVETKIPGASFKFRNAAPGTVFALLGIIMIAFMLAQGMPYLKLEDENTQKTHDNGRVMMETRGKAQKCREHINNLELDKAIKVCSEPIVSSTEYMNDLAWIYKHQEKFVEAFPFAKMAVMMTSPQHNQYEAYLETLSIILCKVKQPDLVWMEKSIEQTPGYKEFSKELSKLRQECG